MYHVRMGSATTTYENKILDSILGDDYGTLMPANVYVALFTVEPTDGGGGTEVVGNGYERVTVANTTSNWPAAVAGEKRNGATITFPQATSDWGDIDWFGLCDAETGGNIMLWGNLQNTISPVAGNTPFFDVGGLIIRLD